MLCRYLGYKIMYRYQVLGINGVEDQLRVIVEFQGKVWDRFLLEWV